MENNQVTLIGSITKELTLSYESFGEKFYATEIKTLRTSGTADFVPVTIPERLMLEQMYKVDDVVEVKGEFRSFNYNGDGSNHLILAVFAKSVECQSPAQRDYNNIRLNGVICKEVVYRQTPFDREIADILLAVNRNYGKSDYLPCIAWNRNARFAKTLKVGDKVTIGGRIQSRMYEKKIGENETVIRTAYEVSISEMAAKEE